MHSVRERGIPALGSVGGQTQDTWLDRQKSTAFYNLHWRMASLPPLKKQKQTSYDAGSINPVLELLLQV